MLKRVLPAALLLAAALGLITACSSDDDDMAICNKAFDTHCACPNVTCSGRPASCTGPDKTWAECINAAADACTANCD